MTHCDNQSKDFSPVNAIKIIINHLQHTFLDTIKHTLTVYPSKSSEIYIKSQTFQKTLRLLTEHNSIWHFAIYQSKDSSPLNVIIYSEVSSTHLSDTIKHTITLYPSKSSEITTKSQTFQKIIILLAENNSIWHFTIYQSKDSSALNVINIFWSIFNTHFRTPSSIHSRSSHQNPQRSQLNHRHFRKLLDFSRKTIQFDTLRLPIKTLLASKRNQIYSEAS